MKQTVWLAGQWRSRDGETAAWELVGVFNTEPEAVAVCRSEQHFVGPVVVGEDMGDPTVSWVGCYYPLMETQEEAAARSEGA